MNSFCWSLAKLNWPSLYYSAQWKETVKLGGGGGGNAAEAAEWWQDSGEPMERTHSGGEMMKSGGRTFVSVKAHSYLLGELHRKTRRNKGTNEWSGTRRRRREIKPEPSDHGGNERSRCNRRIAIARGTKGRHSQTSDCDRQGRAIAVRS